MPTLMIVITSTRPGRVGLPVAQWFTERARAHGAFDLDVVDLLELGLPFMDEPNHPRLHQYTKPHTKAWSARVAAADAFVFVTPEYNYGFNAPLKNALDYLNREWHYKAVGVVSYGGIAAGTRAMQLLKPVLTGLRLVSVLEAVNIPFVRQFLDDEDVFQPNEVLAEAADAMLAELAKMDGALRALRQAPTPG